MYHRAALVLAMLVCIRLLLLLLHRRAVMLPVLMLRLVVCLLVLELLCACARVWERFISLDQEVKG